MSPFDKLGEWKEWDGGYAIYNRTGKLLSTHNGVTREFIKEHTGAYPPISAEYVLLSRDEGKTYQQTKILDGTPVSNN